MIPNQSHLLQLIPKSVGQSELIRVNPRFFNANQNSVWDFQSDWIRTKFLIQMNPRSEWFKLKSQCESFRIIPTSNFLFIHKYFFFKVMFTFFNISDIATDLLFWKVYYRFSTDYYGMLPHLDNIRRKPRVPRHNPHPCAQPRKTQPTSCISITVIHNLRISHPNNLKFRQEHLCTHMNNFPAKSFL